MNIQQFVVQLEQAADPSPLMGALQALRTFDSDLLQEDIRLMDGWIPWGDNETPQAYAQKPELRC